MATTHEYETIAANDSERQELQRIEATLSANDDSHGARLVGSAGEEIALPESVLQVLRQVVHYLAQDKAVSVAPINKVLTTQQAADLLNVSRPYLVKLLEEGGIPFTRVGTHRRIRFDDVMVYKLKRDAERKRGLAHLAQSAQELGIYD